MVLPTPLLDQSRLVDGNGRRSLGDKDTGRVDQAEVIGLSGRRFGDDFVKSETDDGGTIDGDRGADVTERRSAVNDGAAETGRVGEEVLQLPVVAAGADNMDAEQVDLGISVGAGDADINTGDLVARDIHAVEQEVIDEVAVEPSETRHFRTIDLVPFEFTNRNGGFGGDDHEVDDLRGGLSTIAVLGQENVSEEAVGGNFDNRAPGVFLDLEVDAGFGTIIALGHELDKFLGVADHGHESRADIYDLFLFGDAHLGHPFKRIIEAMDNAGGAVEGVDVSAAGLSVGSVDSKGDHVAEGDSSLAGDETEAGGVDFRDDFDAVELLKSVADGDLSGFLIRDVVDAELLTADPLETEDLPSDVHAADHEAIALTRGDVTGVSRVVRSITSRGTSGSGVHAVNGGLLGAVVVGETIHEYGGDFDIAGFIERDVDEFVALLEQRGLTVVGEVFVDCFRQILRNEFKTVHL